MLPEAELKTLLIQNQVIDETTWDETVREASQLNLSPLEILFGRRLLDKRYFGELLSGYLKVPLIDIRKIDIPTSVLRLISESIASERRVIPFALDQNILKVAMVSPQDLETINLLTNLTNHKIEPYLILEDDFQYALTYYQKIYKEKYEELLKKQLSQLDKAVMSVEGQELSAVQIIDNLLGYAMGMNASDIHLEIFADYALIRFRIDGVLREIMRLPKELHPALVARIKILSSLQLDEHFRPQDGRFRTMISNFSFDIRVSILPTLYGEKAVLRLLATTFKPTSLEELGMNQITTEDVNQAMNKSFGLILVTGPTGSGKTTTLYTILQLLNKPGVNIVTIEDPIEYELPHINQSQINPKIDYTFAAGLRSILRQDPNIVMVGEIRDTETVDISIQAALTGHLLLSTIHTNDAPSTIPRLIDLGAPPYLVAATLNLILAQRLVRKVCIDCIVSEPITTSQLESIKQQLLSLGFSQKELETFTYPEFVYHGRGCQLCASSGYRGRIGVFESIRIDQTIKDAISKKDFNLTDFIAILRQRNFKTMFEDGLNKVAIGLTTLEELFRVIRE